MNISFLYICFSLLSSIYITNTETSNFWLDYAKIASVSYSPKNNILNWNCSNCIPGFKDIHFYSIDNIEFLTAISSDNIFWISLRGSDSIEDWLNNIQIELVDLNWINEANSKNIKIHKGFSERWNNLYPFFRDNIIFSQSLINFKNQVKNDNFSNKIIITGHSLGGAIGTILALNMTLYDKDYYILITSFGAPRIGNNEFIELIKNQQNIKIMRFVNKKDLVPHIPPLIASYRHSPQEIWWTGKEIKNCSLIDGEDNECSNRFPAGTSIEDHAYFIDFKFNVS
jgi:hypothetical protein